MAHDYKFKAIVWLSLIMIALAVAAIDAMMYKVNLLNPQNEPAVTNIVFNDVWYKISVLILMIPALFTYYITKSLPRSLLVVLAGMILIFFGLEDVLYFVIRGIILPDQLYAGMDPAAITQISFINHMPNDLYWLNNNICITIFGNPVTQFVLFKSTAFALAMSLILVMI
jgi:hypothetical protein